MYKRINGNAFNYSNDFLINQTNDLFNMLIVLSLHFFLLYCYESLIKVSHEKRPNMLLKLELSPGKNHAFPIYICKLRTCSRYLHFSVFTFVWCLG